MPAKHAVQSIQHKYTLVQDIQSVNDAYFQRTCKEDVLIKYSYRGFALSILRQEDKENDILARMRQYNYRIANLDGVVTAKITDSYTVSLSYADESLAQKAVYLALYYSTDPVKRASQIHELLPLEHKISTQKDTQGDPIGIRADTIIYMFSKQENAVNHIDTKHVKVLTSKFIPDSDDLHAYLNSTYVNMVHDCKTVCSQSVLSDAEVFMEAKSVEKYGLLCADALSKRFASQPEIDSDDTYQTQPAGAQTWLTDIAENKTYIASVAAVILSGGIVAFISRSQSALATRIRSYFTNCVNNVTATVNAVRTVPSQMRSAYTEEMRAITQRMNEAKINDVAVDIETVEAEETQQARILTTRTNTMSSIHSDYEFYDAME